MAKNSRNKVTVKVTLFSASIHLYFPACDDVASTSIYPPPPLSRPHFSSPLSTPPRSWIPHTSAVSLAVRCH